MREKPSTREWLNTFNTTNYRIFVSTWLAVFLVVTLTVGMIGLGFTPNPVQYKVFMGIGGGILTMMGFDVMQFIGKRFSDANYAAAKNTATTGPVAISRTGDATATGGDAP